MKRSYLLFDEKPLLLDRGLAVLIGLNKAIVLQQLHYWLQINERKGHNYYDGHYWVYNTIENWKTENFPFFSCDTIRRTFAALKKKKLIITGNYNKAGFDKTKWYTINYKKLEKMQKRFMRNAQRKAAKGRKDVGKLHNTIPEITPETSPGITPDIKTVAVAKATAEGSASQNQKELDGVMGNTRNNPDDVKARRKSKKWRATFEADETHVTLDDMNAVKTAFDAAWYRLYKNSERPAWGVKEMGQAKDLIKRLRTVTRAKLLIDYIFDNWPQLKEQWRWKAADPSIGLILMKVNLIGEVETQRVAAEDSASHRKEWR